LYNNANIPSKTKEPKKEKAVFAWLTKKRRKPTPLHKTEHSLTYKDIPNIIKERI
jgi:hypothetical protein